MSWPIKAAATVMVLAAAATNGFAAAPKDDAAPPKSEAKQAAPSLETLLGKKLISIDGSMIALTGSEGGLAREIVAPNGAVQKMSFTFINNKLGTVADSRDIKTVIGVFRMTDADIIIEYADGSSETLAAYTGGGISLEAQSAARESYCTVWYPEGHVFSVDDRKAALAQFATKLGLGDLGDKKPDTSSRSSCGAAASARTTEVRPKSEAVLAPPVPVAAPRPAVSASAGAAPAAAATATAVAAAPAIAAAAAAPAIAAAPAVAAAATAKTTVPKVADAPASAKAIDVRTSEVHTIDATATAADSAPPAQVLASIETPSNPAAPTQRGASSCLSVESDGSHWGFRNHCGYTVQFAYCLMTGGSQASCKDGAVPGSVAGNGFGALVTDQSLKETDVAHDFRWVACQGGAGEVIPRLDQTDPPAGRCVR